MIKPNDPRMLAEALLHRSTCSYRAAAVIADAHGILSWGWNSSGRDGYGEHAEAAAIRRANKRRLPGAIIYVASDRKKSENAIYSKPCAACLRLLASCNIGTIWFRYSKGLWLEAQ